MSRGLGDKKDGIAILEMYEVTLPPSLIIYEKRLAEIQVAGKNL